VMTIVQVIRSDNLLPGSIAAGGPRYAGSQARVETVGTGTPSKVGAVRI
jgi:hypothetical protein